MTTTSLRRLLKIQRACTHFNVTQKQSGLLKGPSTSPCLPYPTTAYLLVAPDVDKDEGYDDFAIEAADRLFRRVLFLYAFDETRCKDMLCNLSVPADRAALEA